jgi:hypothetical protein
MFMVFRRLIIDGRLVPRLGYFGPDDVYFNVWVRALAKAARALTTADPASYAYEEGEQGQPAPRFRTAKAIRKGAPAMRAE